MKNILETMLLIIGLLNIIIANFLIIFNENIDVAFKLLAVGVMTLSIWGVSKYLGVYD